MAVSSSGGSRLLLVGAMLLAWTFAVGPMLWAVSTSFKPPIQVLTYPPQILPSPPTTSNFVQVWTESSYPIYFRNSLIVTAISVVAALLLSMHAAYGFARFNFRAKLPLLIGLLATSMIPGIAILVPLYNLSVKVGLYNTFTAMIIVFTAWKIPLLVWLLKGFIEKVPIELEESAYMDGCGRFKSFYLIVVPIARPGLLAGGIMAMLFIWNDFLIAFTLALNDDRRLVPNGLYTFVTNIGVDWGQLMAATVISLIPVTFAFLILQKWLVEGLMAGAVKG